MADSSRRSRNRPDTRQMRDEPDRRNRHGPGSRDNRDDRDRHREEGYRERERDRDRRYRSRSRSPRRDRRNKQRSRSRDRRDRDRDYERDRPRGSGRGRARGDERHHDKERDTNRDERPRRRDQDDRPLEDASTRGTGYSPTNPITSFGHATDHWTGQDRRRDARRSASPTRSPAGGLDASSHGSPLPSRSKSGSTGPSSLSFRVGKHDDAREGRDRVKGHDREDSIDRGRRRGRSADTPRSEGEAMDEDDDLVVEDDGLNAMQAMMGFGGFGTTKGTKVAGNNAGGVRKEKKSEYRQYMNRVGGFNRPLSPGR
ncbi:hypothetical protein F4778DRAFT_134259 [Xylariomycetidae sp. FL2044]|nr:hypothetical protein F4778DRAFT_134259 [Xylariomycetidae sp. FL2044]